MKLSSKDLTSIIKLGRVSHSKMVKEHGFPEPEKIGSKLYYESEYVYQWLSANAEGQVVDGDVLLSNKDIEQMLGRSSAWRWANVSKDNSLTKVHVLSKIFHIEREVKEAFSSLIEAEGVEAA